MKRLIPLLLFLLVLIPGNGLYALEDSGYVTNGDLLINLNETNQPADIDGYLAERGSLARAQESLPEKYSLRESLPAVRNQMPYGACWAFGPLASVESNAIYRHGADSKIDLSEKALVLFSAKLRGLPGQMEGRDSKLTNSQLLDRGGNNNEAAALLTTWQGDVNESRAAYPSVTNGFDTNIDPSLLFKTDYHVDNAFCLYSPINFKTKAYSQELAIDNIELMKKLLLDYGALSITYNSFSKDGINLDNGAVYNAAPEFPDHAVAIIGWDDSYPKTNFKVTPPNNGAWLVRNSYGSNVDDGGYFYLSYYDQSMGTPYVFTGETEGHYSYDNLYLYDYLGNQNSLGDVRRDIVNNVCQNKEVKTANIFTAIRDEDISAVTIQAEHMGASVKIEVYRVSDSGIPDSGELVAVKKITLPFRGYQTIPLDEDVSLKKGEKFSVIETVFYPSEEYYDLPVEMGYDQNDAANVQDIDRFIVQSAPGESFVSVEGLQNGEWMDLSSNEARKVFSVFGDGATLYPGNAMIRALTNTPGESLPKQFVLNVECEPREAGAITGAGIYLEGEVATLSQEPRDGYIFEGWYAGNTKISEESEVAVRLETDLNVIAKYRPTRVVLSVSVDPAGSGDVSGTGEYDLDSPVNLSATARDDYIFLGYYLNGEQISSEPNYSIVMDNSKALVARFEKKAVPSSPSSEPVYRLYNPNSGEHLYTTDKNESIELAQRGWNDEGVGWNTTFNQGDGVYRLFNKTISDHLYTQDQNEVQTLLQNPDWSIDNGGQPLFYSNGGVSIYRLYNPNNKRHHLTKDAGEYSVLESIGWSGEGAKLNCVD